MQDWMLNKEDYSKLRLDGQPFSHTWCDCDVVAKAQARKIAKWLGGVCHEHSYVRNRPPTRIECIDCMQQFRKEVRL
jgi:hypothetical protein